MINHWAPGQIPYSWQPKSTITEWVGTDSQHNFDKNPDKDIWKNIPVSYSFNSNGFRTYELDKLLGKKVNVALGCSFTAGIGMPLHSIWPTLIEKQVEHPVINLGIGGGSNDTIARVLTNISTLFQIQTVYILWTFKNRFELHNNDIIKCVYPEDANIEYVWNLEESMSEQRYFKNKLIVNMLAQQHNFKIIEFDISDFFQYYKDFGRDYAHFGFETHKIVANLFLTS